MSDEYRKKRNESRNKEKSYEALKKWRDNNRDKVKAIQLRANEKRREQMREYARSKREENPLYKVRSTIIKFSRGEISREELLSRMHRAHALFNEKDNRERNRSTAC